MLDGTRNQPADAHLFKAPVPDAKRGSDFTGRDGLMTFATQIFGDIPATAEVRYWDNKTVREHFSMYGENTLYIDEALIIGNDGLVAFTVPESFMAPHFTPETGELLIDAPEFDPDTRVTAVNAHLTVTPEHTRNHFTPEAEASFFQGHKQVAIAVETAKAALQGELTEGEFLELMGLTGVEFKFPVIPGDELTVHAETVPNNWMHANATIKRGDRTVATIGDMDFEPYFNFEKDEAERPYLSTDRQAEAAAQALGAVFLANQEGGDKLPLFKGLGSTEYYGVPIHPGETVITHAWISEQDEKGFTGTANIYIEDALALGFEKVECNLSDRSDVVRLYGMLQKAQQPKPEAKWDTRR